MNSWINKRAAEGSIGVVSDDASITCSLKNEALDEAQAKIQAGEAPLNVLGKDAIHIPYFNVTSVEFDEHEEAIEIAYKSRKEGKNETISFTDKEARKAAFQLIELRLGEGFTSLTELHEDSRHLYALDDANYLRISDLGHAWRRKRYHRWRRSGDQRTPSGHQGDFLLGHGSHRTHRRIDCRQSVHGLGGHDAGAAFQDAILAGLWYLFVPAVVISFCPKYEPQLAA